MNAHDVIEAGVKEWEWRGGPVTPRILEAITVAGYALVKLPEPNREDGEPTWSGPYRTWRVQERNAVHGDWGEVWLSEDATLEAACILAAARAAEAQS